MPPTGRQPETLRTYKSQALTGFVNAVLCFRQIKALPGTAELCDCLRQNVCKRFADQ